MTARGGLATAGLVLACLFSAFNFFEPLRLHVLPFLAVYALCFLVYLFSIFLVPRTGESNKGNLWLVLGFGTLFRLMLLPTIPSLSDDIYRYVWDGRVQQAGINPFLYPPASEDLSALRNADHGLINHPTVRTVYPPLSQAMFRLGVAFKPTIQTQRMIFMIFDLGTAALLCGWLSRLKRSVLGAIVYAWNPLAVVEFASSGHNDSLMIFFFTLALFLLSEGKKAVGGVAWGLAVLSKLIPVILIPWVVMQKSHRIAAACFATLIVVCLPFSNVLFDPVLRSAPYLSGLTSYASDWVFNPSLYGLLTLVTENRMWIKLILGLVLIVFSFYWALRCREDVTRYAFGCVFALLLASPVVHPWYVLWLLPFLCLEMNGSALMWTGLVPLTYLVLVRYVASGVWSLPVWIPWVEYGFVYGALVVQSVRERRRHV